MVVGAFPAAKLGTLLLKQISKPIANVVKNQAKSSPFFRKYVCMPPAHFYNWCEVKSKMWILNLGKPVHIPVLNEAMAIELGANLLGEGIIFIIAAGILIAEYNRSSNKEAAKEEAKKKELYDMQNTIRDLFIQAEEQNAQLRELTRKIVQLGNSESITGKKLIKPSTTNLPVSTKTPPANISLVQNSVSCPEPAFPKSRGPNTLIFRAVRDVENQFWDYPLMEQEESIISLSLYYVQRLLKFQQ